MWRAAVLVVLFSLLPMTSYAQSASGAILGDIVDTTGGRLPAATVKVVSQQTGATREMISSEVGSYRFNALPPAAVSYTHLTLPTIYSV